jgi:hypothetical protein
MANDPPPMPHVTGALPDGDRPDHIDEMAADDATLAALGYKQEFKVRVAKPPSARLPRLTASYSASSLHGLPLPSASPSWVCCPVLPRL